MENESLIPKSNIQSTFYATATLAIVIVGLVYLGGILKPLVIAFLVWFVINKLKITIGKIRIRGRSLPPLVCNILALTIILITFYLIGELMIFNLEGMAASMPEYVSNLNDFYNNLSTIVSDPKYAEYGQKWFNAFDFSGLATSAVNSISGLIGYLAVVIIYVIFFLIEEANRKTKKEKLFMKKGIKYKKFTHNVEHINEAIRSYIWTKTLISLSIGAVSYVALALLGVEYAFLWSFLIFLFNFIPYIGPLISSLLPAIFAVMTTGEPMRFVYVFVAMEGVQVVISNFIEPKVMGKGSNLGPVTVLLALSFWGLIWGIAGMILAVPVTSVIVIILSQIPSTRYLAVLLSEKGNLPEIKD